ncbi:hypothetical protein ACO1O0_001436 [Amphichorda felina]
MDNFEELFQEQPPWDQAALDPMFLDDTLFSDIGDTSILDNNGDFNYQSMTNHFSPPIEHTNSDTDSFSNSALLAWGNLAPVADPTPECFNPALLTQGDSAPNVGLGLTSQQSEYLSPSQNNAWNFQDPTPQESPAVFGPTGSGMPPQQDPKTCSLCFFDAYEADPSGNGTNLPAICPHTDVRLAVDDDFSGLSSAFSYPEPTQMPQTNVPPYGSHRSAVFQPTTQQSYARRSLPPAPSTTTSSTASRYSAPLLRRSHRRNQGSFKASSVSPERPTKRRRQNDRNPIEAYPDEIDVPETWGPVDQPSLFCYTRDGRLVDYRKYTAQQIRTFIDQNPRELTLWVQNHPAQCKHRLPNKHAIQCMWESCPARDNKIGPGWLQVAFDEFPVKTSDGTRDPFNVAGFMHLWCFEQCFDAVHDYKSGKLQPEDRNLPKEKKNPMRLERDSADADVIHQTFSPWFIKNTWMPGVPLRSAPRTHEETLSYAMITHHLEHQNRSRAEARERHNKNKDPSERITIDIHRGNLQFWAEVRFPRLGPYNPTGPNAFQMYTPGGLPSYQAGISGPGLGDAGFGYGHQDVTTQGGTFSTPTSLFSPTNIFTFTGITTSPNDSEAEQEANKGPSTPERQQTSGVPQPSRRSARLSDAQSAPAFPQPQH